MISLLKRQQILLLLETGLSIKAVADRMHVVRNTVSAIKNKPNVECQFIGTPAKERKMRKIKLTGLMEAYIAESSEIFRIVEDLKSLHELGLIEHRLFVNLGERAKKSFDRIFPPIRGNNAKKKEATEISPK